MTKTVLLDLDGTLTDPYPGISRSVLHALTMLNAPKPVADELGGWIGPSLKSSFSAWFEAHAVTADPDDAIALYRERFSRIGLYENEVYSGVPKMLAELVDSGTRLVLATSKPLVYASKILQHFGLDKYFWAEYGSELDGRYSDKTELLGMILQRHELHASDCIMVGDRHHDIDAARSHAMASIGVLWGYGDRAELEKAGASRICKTIADLASLLMR